MLLAVALCAGCVGPAPSMDSYVAKAGGTAAEAVSAARTAVLVVQTDQRGQLTAAGREVLLQESEAALGSIADAFGSIQPPDNGQADAIRHELGDLLAAAHGDAQELRIAARRGDARSLATHATALAETADGLDDLATELGQ